jgi:uncharacterized protein (DUF1778 family)
MSESNYMDGVSAQVSFLLSESEYQAVKQAATLSNVSMSEWIRGATNAALQVSIDQRKAMMKISTHSA